MMINNVGKALVLLLLLLSSFFAVWAGAIYTQRVDWGWKDPRKEFDGDRIPSEIDKRTALINELLPIRDQEDQALDGAKKGPASLIGMVVTEEMILAENHGWYDKMLASLESAPGKVDILQIKYDKNGVVLDNMARPVLEKPATFTDADKKITPLDKSYVGYRADLKKTLGDMDTVTKGIEKWINDQKGLTIKLNGTKDEAGKEVDPGLYDLLTRETAIQEELKKETAYLRPLWVRELVDAQLLLQRQEGLRARLAELKRAGARHVGNGPPQGVRLSKYFPHRPLGRRPVGV
jgi:hypothetical protein